MNVALHKSNGSPHDGFDLSHDNWGRLVVIDSEGNRHTGVEPVRAFPITDPEHCISIRDTNGHEIVWIEDLASLPDDIRTALEEELSRREFMPVIRQILSVSAHSEPSEWDVETDRGRGQFLLNNEDDVRRLEGHRAMIIDAHGIRYLIPDTRQLDTASRHVVERYL